ncbi:MAG: hypothetical protein ACK5LN_03205 [Propioniciclava sp.]
MSAARSDATSHDLSVTGYWILPPAGDPQPAPILLGQLGDFGTDSSERIERYHAEQAAFVAYQAKLTAFLRVRGESMRAYRAHENAIEKLREAFSTLTLITLLLKLGDVLGKVALAHSAILFSKSQFAASLGAANFQQASEVLAESRASGRSGAGLNRGSKRTIRHLTAADERYTAARGYQDQGMRFQRLATAGKVLGLAGAGLGIYSDWRDGEPTEQIIASQGGAIVAGMAAGALFGTLVPVPIGGTLIGVAIGALAGATVAIFTDGAIDSLFENGPDVERAFLEGGRALAETGDTIRATPAAIAGAFTGGR